MRNYNNRIAFVCGGSSGIGLAVAVELARAGARVVLFARRKDVLQDACSKIEREVPGKTIVAYSVDLGEERECRNALQRAVDEVGIPDLVVNSVGGASPLRFLEIGSDQLEEIWKKNFCTCWNVCKALVPLMVEKRVGSIINISSMAGLFGVYGYTDYCATKFGVVGFSEALRSEVIHYGVRVQVFCPADTLTPGFERENVTKPMETVALSEAAKIMTAEDVARALIRGIERRNFVIFANRESRILYTLNRLCPWLLRWGMDRITARAARGSRASASTEI